MRLRSSIFFRKNGLYIALGLCIAVIGTTAALIFTGGEEPSDPVRQSQDQTLNDVTVPTTQPTQVTTGPRPARTPLPTVMPEKTIAPMPTTPAVQTTPAPIVLHAPVEGNIIRVFAMDSLIYSETLNQWMTHSGVDIAAPQGTEVRSVAEGTVERVYADDMLGVTVVIRHSGGMVTVYSNLKEEPPVTEGQAVNARDVIGYIGDTALSECAEESHLHFELYIDDEPKDPTQYVTFTHTD